MWALAWILAATLAGPAAAEQGEPKSAAAEPSADAKSGAGDAAAGDQLGLLRRPGEKALPDRYPLTGRSHHSHLWNSTKQG